jgi:hypothetical protein
MCQTHINVVLASFSAFLTLIIFPSHHDVSALLHNQTGTGYENCAGTG